jgi:hypothetical protein
MLIALMILGSGQRTDGCWFAAAEPNPRPLRRMFLQRSTPGVILEFNELVGTTTPRNFLNRTIFVPKAR